MMTTRILGTGSAVPKTNVTNDELSRVMDTSDEWIATRTGIHTRYMAKEETGVSMAVEAARNAMEQAGTDPEEIELILVATCSPDRFLPNTACSVQSAIGAVNAMALDINAACSGFLSVLHTAHAYFMAGIYRKALLIGVESMTRLTDWKDRSTSVLFGDGAGAVIVEASETGIIDFVQHADGSRGEVLTCKTGLKENLLNGEQEQDRWLHMQGQEVFRFAVTKVPECIREVLEKSGTDPEEIRWFLLHQANSRIIQSVAKRLGISQEKFPVNLQKYGNTSAASIPILLDEMNRAGKFAERDKLILSGFGAGLTWAATLLEW